MIVIVTYDVNTTTKSGQGRLRHVAKECTKYGKRVQSSVFECNIDNAQFVVMKATLLSIVDKSTDSIRFYKLGNNYNRKIEHYGVSNNFEQEDILIA